MKKILAILTIFVAISGLLITPAAFAQSKSLKKDVSKKVKQLTKEGWKTEGSRTLEAELFKYYEKINDDEKYSEIFGSSLSKSKNVGQQKALNNAVNKYANLANSYVRGRVSSDVGQIKDQEIDNFYAAYERQVSANISGALATGLALVKELKTGNIEYRVYFVVNNKIADEVKLKAFQEAVKESKLAQEYATSISTFIKEGFETEE